MGCAAIDFYIYYKVCSMCHGIIPIDRAKHFTAEPRRAAPIAILARRGMNRTGHVAGGPSRRNLQGGQLALHRAGAPACDVGPPRYVGWSQWENASLNAGTAVAEQHLFVAEYLRNSIAAFDLTWAPIHPTPNTLYLCRPTSPTCLCLLDP